MTAKSDFSDEEWKVIVEGPPTAGMILLTADSGGTFRETFALARAYTDARREHGESELLDELVAAKPEFDRHRYKTTADLHDTGLEQLGKGVALLRAKASPEETEAYRKFVLTVATNFAAAHKEKGEQVSPKEQAALDEVRGRLEAEA